VMALQDNSSFWITYYIAHGNLLFSIDKNPEASTPHPVGFYVVLSDFRTHHGILKIGVFYAHLLIFSVQ